jgi:proline iminopeptidase
VMGPLYSRTFDERKFEENWSCGISNHEQLNRGFGAGGFLRSFDWRPELPSIACPTLVLAAAHDWICPPSQSEEIARLIPRAHLKVFGNSGHGLPVDEPEAYLTVLRGFLIYAAR